RLDPAERQLLRDGAPVPLTPKVFETLVVLVERSGHLVEKEELLKLVWADAFVEEANLARCVHTLRKALGEEHNGHKYIETVPKRGYRFVAEVREIANGGSNVATLDQAEAQTRGRGDAATQEVKPETPPDNEAGANGFALSPLRPVTPSPLLATPRRRLSVSVFIIPLALVVAAAAVGAYFYFNRSRQVATDQTPINSIAVLPFVNAGANPEVEYLSDGISESLINSLSQLPKLSVKARSSVFRYKGKEIEPQQVGAELNVQAILNGRVVQRGDDLTLSLSLVDARNGNQLWGEQYKRKLADLVSLQGEIARDVSDKLRQKLTGADDEKLAKNYTQNTQAYQLYLKGRFHWNKRTPQDLQKAIAYFQQAIAIDPNYALAYTGLADAYALLANAGTPPREMMPRARAAALKALSLDDNLAEAHTALGQIIVYYDYDFAGAEREHQRAIELNPNYATAHQWYSELLTGFGRHEEALAEMRRALEIDPLSLIINRQYGVSLLFARQYDAALAQLHKTLELDANFALAHSTLSLAYRLKGDYAASVEELAKYEELIGEQQNAAMLRESFARSGWQGFLRTMSGERRPANSTPYIVATFHAALGEKDKAFAELNKSYENREAFLALLKVDPRFDSLRADPRFQELLRRVGLPQ
ncbi:MAG: winged helix-turn-helix domain-containing protein, partial [Acidobacteriota bacterium]|nr:winged helix-turn-helix domain-containing protein [Acidobacteriota bacterium]